MEAADRMQTADQHLRDISRPTVQQAQQVGSVLKARAPQMGQNLGGTLDHIVLLVRQVVTQTTRHVIRGEAVSAPETRVNLFEPHTAVIRQGKPGRPTAFGPVMWWDGAEGGFISRYAVREGNPAEEAHVPPSPDHQLRLCQRPHRLLAGTATHPGDDSTR
jgi:hypothetical protein